MDIVGAFMSLTGALFLFLGTLGIIRMPDVYNRMQAGTKATTLGSMLFLLGLAIGNAGCLCTGKIILLVIFIIFTNPISSHALARAAHAAGIRLTSTTVRDDLDADKKKGEQK
ncbi:MAG: monovalent cation/H(+) antiporter subunit G [Candidatus Cloacimonetes bacterium]|nr:monovalent cation/H(+) antiporter subunit G [Candidatus Cloacimonadota bacterium]